VSSQSTFVALPGEAPTNHHRASLRTRLVAAVLASRLDHALAVGGTGPQGTAVGQRAARLTSYRERHDIARTLRRALREAHFGRRFGASTIPVNDAGVLAAEHVIDAITLRLHSPRPVGAMGMARLRRLLADGTGPFYACGRGDLDGRLRAALAAL
jgi:hypothetical protein